jgi:hypothetical protein
VTGAVVHNSSGASVTGGHSHHTHEQQRTEEQQPLVPYQPHQANHQLMKEWNRSESEWWM